MTDFMDKIKLTMEWDVIQGLMSGNDTQCFSLEQYVEARDKWITDVCGMTREGLGITESEQDRYWLLEYARRQLAACPFVLEVKPGVYTFLESEVTDE